MGFDTIPEELMSRGFRVADLPGDFFSCWGERGVRDDAQCRCVGATGCSWSFLQVILASGERETVQREGQNGVGTGERGGYRGEGGGKPTYFSGRTCSYTRGRVTYFLLQITQESKTGPR